MSGAGPVETDAGAGRRGSGSWIPIGWALGGAVAAGGAVGVALRFTSSAGGAARASAAWTVVFACAVVAAAALPHDPRTRRERVRALAVTLTSSGTAAAAAVLAAGASLAALGAAVVAGAACVLSAGAAMLLRGWGVSRGGALLLGAALPVALGGLIFVADPFIEWDGPGPASAARARRVLRVNPVAAATSPNGGLGFDWQTAPLLYDDPALSVIGQYYPTRPPSPFLWSLGAAVVGLVLAVCARSSAAPGDRRAD